ncbi:MAG: deoxynucleoside kinase [Bacteroidia bacterium]
MSNLYDYIVIEGNIGAGKSSLAKKLAATFNGNLILEEFEDNSFLPKFYAEPRRYAFTLEMSFLATRFNQLKNNLLQPALFSSCIIADYIFAKCMLFSKVNLEDDEYNLYLKLFEIINLQLPNPDILIYLHNNIERLQFNIKNRGRIYEQNISDEYLQNLQQTYLNYLNQIYNFPVLVVDCNGLDFVNNLSDFENICNLFSKPHKKGINYIKP